MSIMREGVMLNLPGGAVWVDAPCSGVRMLWGGVWLTLTLSGMARLGWWRTALTSLLGVVMIALANLLRVIGLTLSAAGLLPEGPVFHVGIGMAAFFCGIVAIGACVSALQPAPPPRRAPNPAPGPAQSDLWERACYILICLAAIGWPLLRGDEAPPTLVHDELPAWPETFEGAPLVAAALSPEETAFAGRFPGRIGRFTCGDQAVIIRWVIRPTHRVHGAADCMRASGWRIKPQAVHATAEGVWGCFQARRGGSVLNVREQCLAPDGRTWADVSSWFWAALCGNSQGPWQVITVAAGESSTGPAPLADRGLKVVRRTPVSSTYNGI
jgi:exosortase/archaeosortase family protein